MRKGLLLLLILGLLALAMPAARSPVVGGWRLLLAPAFAALAIR